MNRHISFLVLVLLFALTSISFAAQGSGSLFKIDNTAVQTFVPDPLKSQVNASMTGTITFKKGSGGTVDVTGWTCIRIDPTADSTWYFNTENTKTYPLRSGSDNLIWVSQIPTGGYVTVVLGAATASVQGM